MHKYFLVLNIFLFSLIVNTFSYGMNRNCILKSEMNGLCGTGRKLLYVCNAQNPVLHQYFLDNIGSNGQKWVVTASDMEEAVKLVMTNKDAQALEFLKQIQTKTDIFYLRKYNDNKDELFLKNLPNLKIEN